MISTGPSHPNQPQILSNALGGGQTKRILGGQTTQPSPRTHRRRRGPSCAPQNCRPSWGRSWTPGCCNCRSRCSSPHRQNCCLGGGEKDGERVGVGNGGTPRGLGGLMGSTEGRGVFNGETGGTGELAEGFMGSTEPPHGPGGV